MPAGAGEHYGVAAADVLALDAGAARCAQGVHDVGVAFAGGEHEWGLVLFIEGYGGSVVAEGDEELDDGEKPEL